MTIVAVRRSDLRRETSAAAAAAAAQLDGADTRALGRRHRSRRTTVVGHRRRQRRAGPNRTNDGDGGDEEGPSCCSTRLTTGAESDRRRVQRDQTADDDDDDVSTRPHPITSKHTQTSSVDAAAAVNNASDVRWSPGSRDGRDVIFTSGRSGSGRIELVQRVPPGSRGAGWVDDDDWPVYDPMTGVRTAAVLGGCMLLVLLFIAYKTRCGGRFGHGSGRARWTSKDRLFIEKYKRKIQERYNPRPDCLVATTTLSTRRGAVASLADAVRQNRHQISGGIALSDRSVSVTTVGTPAAPAAVVVSPAGDSSCRTQPGSSRQACFGDSPTAVQRLTTTVEVAGNSGVVPCRQRLLRQSDVGCVETVDEEDDHHQEDAQSSSPPPPPHLPTSAGEVAAPIVAQDRTDAACRQPAAIQSEPAPSASSSASAPRPRCSRDQQQAPTAAVVLDFLSSPSPSGRGARSLVARSCCDLRPVSGDRGDGGVGLSSAALSSSVTPSSASLAVTCADTITPSQEQHTRLDIPPVDDGDGRGSTIS